ncbi:hypothetical protein M8C21_017950 [Ambrosia artemisiifolia]|uniref:C3H1-type domain-containing protein n=1 Tax=Ambrosia artemisiifolia TaxID=4212 RepID=A0AAD5BLG1_AMBAR|nr:hypothetical protein M8C21_017950 [Ambrosia artemisiifolia]
MDEEELQKRFTDCVYFLASPLTCKKGIECEFRHNEIARLNPRDCWYWMGGCCYNPECAFRHPPLEGLKEAYYESLNPSNGPALPVDKTNLPCYFYSKGFCNKADRCSFLHEPADKSISMVKNGVLNENKLPVGNKTGPTPVQVIHTQPDPPNTAQIEDTHTVMNYNPDSHQVPSRSESVESEEHVEREEIVESEENVEQEETVESEEDAAESEEMFVQSESDVYNDQSSDGYVEREKWLDLSPRFFAKGESERLEYEEDDVDFFLVNDEDHRQLKYQYPEYDRIDKIAGQSRVSIFDRLSFKKRSIHKRLIFNVQRGSDLRGYLEKSKLVDFDRRIRKKFRPHGSRGEVVFDHRGSLRKAVPVNRYRPPLKKPRFVSSDVSRVRKPAQQHKREYREQSAAFTGPKTLEQIKEEKIKARENRDFGSNNRTGSDGCFQAPRPLSEILKNKRKLG